MDDKLNKDVNETLVNSTIDSEGEQRYHQPPTEGEKAWHEFLDAVSLILMNYKNKKEGADNA